MPQNPGDLIPDKNQQQAIEHVNGPMLVLAGAGTGKTTVLTHRIRHLIEGRHAAPEQILAVTYTINASAELVYRLKTRLAVRCDGLNADTFHGYCCGILKRAERQFELIDDNDLWVYLRQRIEVLDLKHFIEAGDLGRFLHDLLDFFRRCHDELVSPDDYDAYVARLVKGEVPPPRVAKSKDAELMSPEEAIGRCGEIARVYRKVEAMLATDGLGTFGHMISRAVRLLESDAQILDAEQSRTRFILIDEFQDSNLAQVRLAKLLAGTDSNVFAVGDPDQAIYRFRGATSGAFELFLRYFGAQRVKTVNMSLNRRSTQKILDCACVAIADNPDVVSAQSGVSFKRERLTSAREQQTVRAGESFVSRPVEFVVTPDSRTEAVEIAQAIQRLRAAANCEWEDFAVLYRNHWHRTELAQELQEQEIPFVVRGVRVDATTPVRDLTAALRALVTMDDSVSIFRLAAVPQFGIDPQELRAALAAARRRTPMSAVLGKVGGGGRLLKAVEQARTLIASAGDRALAAVDAAINISGLSREAAEVRAFRSFVEQWHKKPEIVRGSHSVESFLAYLDRFYEAGGAVCIPEPPEESALPNAVRLMTVHAAKGLEFKYVFVLKARGGSFPSYYKEPLVDFPQEVRDAQTIAEGDAKQNHREEERRLFYVALTRAKDALTLVAAKGTGKKDLRPSGFARDLHDSVKRMHGLNTTAPAIVVRFAEAARVPAIAASAVSSPLHEWMMLPPRVGLHELKLSATAIETYRRCPLQFKLERDWNIPGEPTAALQYGAAMHLALRAYFEARKNGKQLGHDDLMGCFKSQFDESPIAEEYQRRLLEQRASDQINAFLKSPESASTAEVMATEMGFDVNIGGARVVGRIDRLDRITGNQVTVVDYKTGKPKSQEDADGSLQLSVYALAMRETGLIPERLRLYNLHDQSSFATTRLEEQLKADREIIASVAMGIANEQFDATPDRHCDFCAYYSICPEKEEASVPVAMSFKAKTVQ
jgi:DNA helicase II / ATP-dependent DNA helicase PcrA